MRAIVAAIWKAKPREQSSHEVTMTTRCDAWMTCQRDSRTCTDIVQATVFQILIRFASLLGSGYLYTMRAVTLHWLSLTERWTLSIDKCKERLLHPLQKCIKCGRYTAPLLSAMPTWLDMHAGLFSRASKMRVSVIACPMAPLWPLQYRRAARKSTA
ncbi:uncharacterized protein MYCFIDRAFT_173788 [Pseudocercospora fijiensis CIRAD86]|uniref:Uncharacterized protein n=1 Tax=Pseudocercospora fijiensis (strain CIRAD86) TaxID=383855 RepID=M3AJY7_PSEFD|nr:uncharacterized protein MYCFIDRAFT_173788 [Pseudocercospora fijiensis CIRAD86]EME84891.1 hypothetical protein MYCFIDRAFT_173788 [Pseudocercospora fijiensis CIRAD86]